MSGIVYLLFLLSALSLVWTIIQVIKPEWFYKAEEEANLKRKRPVWYFLGGVLGLTIVVWLWVLALQFKLISVWILTIVFTLGSLKAVGMVFFYDKFSGGVTKAVDKMKESQKTYRMVIVSRGVLSVLLGLSASYFAGWFGVVI